MKSFLILTAALLLSLSASAQDLLVKRNGEQMRVKVLKITKKKVQFVRQGTELPVYTLPISDIDYIEYPMGERDTFGRTATAEKEEPKKVDMWHGAVPPHNGSAVATITPKQEPSNESGYIIGDIYDRNGVKGIVVMVYEGGKHGLIMSLDEACLAWSKLHRKQQKTVGASDRYDGEKNMKAVEKYINEKGLSWSDFPAFEWCRSKGNGWYLPSINELWSAGTMYLGGSRTASNRKSRKFFNASLENAGGTPLSGIMIYHSSTEDKDPKYSLYSHMNSEPPYIQSGYKADDLFVRAFRKF